MRSVYIKEGPVVFLKQVLFMEIVAGVSLFVASFLSNYEMLYRKIKFDDFLRYDNFIMISFSLFQLIYLIALFLNWYFSYFEIRDNELMHKSGVIFHNRKTYLLKSVISIGTLQSPIDRLIDHATIVLEDKNGPVIKLRNVPNFGEYLAIFKRAINRGSDKNFLDIESLRNHGEDDGLEYKETLRFDVRTGTVNKDLERAVLKSIVGFMNADGGTLAIGVKDDRGITGLKNDMETLPKKNKDGFENHLNSLIRELIGVNANRQVRMDFLSENGKDICVLNIEPTPKPVYLKSGDKEEFFVRVGNSTRAFSMSEAEEYIRRRFN